jgi:hypothetical protein
MPVPAPKSAIGFVYGGRVMSMQCTGSAMCALSLSVNTMLK